MKIALIVPYFGTLPNYFQLFLDSCGYNPKFDWLIFTDDDRPFRYPDNVHKITMSFNACKALVQSRFDFETALSAPMKLCDFRCAFGIIFQKYLTEYNWWGHCDLDQIFGNLGAFITEEMLNTYDKIGSLGHLTLYRNTPENNRVFMEPLKGRCRYREVFTTERGCAFDEWLPDNINDIYLASGRPVHLENCGADVHSYHTAFRLVDYDIPRRCYQVSPIHNSVFRWEAGKLTQIYKENGQLQHREFPYIHLQKRQMTDRRRRTNSPYYIFPTCFADRDREPEALLRMAGLRGVVNTQFFKVKWKSLRYRIKNGDWVFTNVFKM